MYHYFVNLDTIVSSARVLSKEQILDAIWKRFFDNDFEIKMYEGEECEVMCLNNDRRRMFVPDDSENPERLTFDF